MPTSVSILRSDGCSWPPQLAPSSCYYAQVLSCNQWRADRGTNEVVARVSTDLYMSVDIQIKKKKSNLKTTMGGPVGYI